MLNRRRNYVRGTRPTEIGFDPGRPYSTTGGNGDIFYGMLHHTVYENGSTFEYSEVALKRMRCGTADEDTRFDDIIKENYVWMDLHHPNLLRFMGILQDNIDMYLVSPFAPHGSLPRYLLSHPEADRRTLLWQIAAGIAYLHSKEIVHGDVKGANILVFEGPTAKICDFGLAKIADGRQTTTPQYSLPWTGPERLLGEPRSYASDVYAFGMTVYEILSGKSPILKFDPFKKLTEAVCEQGMRPPKDPDSCCAGLSYALLWLVAERCWEGVPEIRPPMSEARDMIATAGADTVAGGSSDDLPVMTMPPPPPNTTITRRKRNDSAETMQASESSRAGTRRKIHPSSDGGGNLGLEISKHEPGGHSADPRIESLSRAKSASHKAAKDSSAVCLPGTRTVVLQRINDWVKTTDPDIPRVFWLNGMAGTGKSTIAKTLAEQADRNNVLGASFFFDRHGHPEVRNGDLFASTIAFQLAQAIPSLRSHLSSALEKNVDVLSFTRHAQLQTLLVVPLQAIMLPDPAIVVIDALDECDSRDAKELLQLLLQMMSEPQIPNKFKIFISCRPDRELDIAFRTAQAHQLLLLHEVEQDVVQADIELYLTKELTNPPPDPSLPPDWITTAELKELSRRSGALFIYAKTLLNYIRDNEVDSSSERLQLLLSAGHDAGENPLADLDALYLQVLRTTIKSLSPRATEAITKRVRCVLGTLVLLRSPLSVGALAKIIATPLDQIRMTLERIQSIISPSKSIGDEPQFLHSHFPTSSSILVAVGIIYSSSMFKRRVKGSDTETDIEMEVEVEAEVAYACSHWASHLAKSPPGNEELLRKLELFSSRFLLCWLEALSVMGQVGQAAGAADDAFKWAVRSRASEETTALLRDANHFILAHLACISDDPRHVYSLALPFTPRATSLWRLYRHKADFSVHVSSGVEESWSACLTVLTGHQAAVNSLALSPGGTHIASGSKDKTVRIWDAASGQFIAVMEGHFSRVTAVAFSPDGVQIASSSWDSTVRIWDVASGKSIRVLEGHSEGVTTIAFSPDGTCIASGSFDTTAQIWDTASGQPIATLVGHSGSVKAVIFSPNGACIASRSHDQTVRIWNTTSGQSIPTLDGHSGSIDSITFSPHGTWIVLGSQDHTVRIWDTASGQPVTVLEGHADGITTVSFSPEGSRIFSGSLDCTLRTWDATSWRPTTIMKGHSDGIVTAKFSPDGTRIVSGSDDTTARIWDAALGLCIGILNGHSNSVTTVTFSLDGARITSGSKDKTVRIWDAASAESTSPVGGHSRRVTTVAFSPDGSRVASASLDHTVRLWDVASGESTATLNGHSKSVNMIAFSPDSTRIVSGSDDDVRIWDATSAQSVTISNGYSNRVVIVAFTPDGTRVVLCGSGMELWVAVPAQFLASLKGHSNSVTTVAFSLDGNRIVSGSKDNTVRIWNAHSGRPLTVLEGHRGAIRSVAVSPNCSRIASSSEDQTIRVWDAGSGLSIGSLLGISTSVTAVAFSPDSTRILLLSSDEVPCSWDFTSGVSAVGARLSSDSEIVSIFQNSVTREDAVTTMLSEWYRLSRVPAFVACGLGMRIGCLSPDGSVAAVGCQNGRVFIFKRPRGGVSHVPSVV